MQSPEQKPLRSPTWLKRLMLFCLVVGVLMVRPATGALLATAAPLSQEGQFAPPATRVPGAPDQPIPSEYGRGYISPRANVAHLTESNRQAAAQLSQALPARWNWRDSGIVTGVRDQGECGACYAFAGLGSLESQLLSRGEGTWDLSENNIAECSYESAGCVGGHIWIVTNRLSRYGAVQESCDPYSPADQACNTGCAAVKIVDGVSILGNDSVPDTSLLKNWLYTYGPLYITMDSGSSSSSWNQEFHNYNGSYTLYHPGSYNLDHAVLLVGWDDTLSHTGGQGAWLVKNSWGTSWGDNGYFRMAYGSAGLGSNAAAITSWHDPQPSERLLLIDEGGWQLEYGWQSQLTGWGMTRLLPDTTGCISQLEIWTTDRTEQVSLALYDSFNGSAPSALLRQLPNTNFLHAGYHKVAVEPPLSVSAGNDIYLVAYIQNNSYWAVIPIDDLGPTQSGQSYVSASGSAGSWIDLGAQGADVALRARLVSCAAQATATPTRTPTPTATLSRTATLTATRTRTPTATATGPTNTPRPMIPRLWLPLNLRLRVMSPAVTSTPTRSTTPGASRTLSATATHTPGPTVPITPAGDWTLVYSHDFEQRDGTWGEGTDIGSQVAYVDGQYAFTVSVPNWRTVGLSGLACEDCAIEVDAALSGGTYGMYGIQMFSPITEETYLYRLYSSGMYAFRYEMGAWGTNTIPPTTSSAIETGNGVNRLRLERLDGTLRLLVNDVHLATLTGDEVPGAMQIGLTASASNSVPIQVRFDRIRVYEASTGSGIEALPAAAGKAHLLARPTLTSGVSGRAEEP